MSENKAQEVRVVLKTASSECSVHIGDVDITHLTNEVRVESKVGHPMKLFLGVIPTASLVTIDGYAVVSAIEKDKDAA